ncbi:MAG: hypothetical protein WA188_01840 [Terriglobales bacterium]
MGEGTPPRSIRIYYRKANFFRVVHIDGALGGITPTRNIFVSLYNQRTPLPLMIEQEFSPDGTLGAEVSKTGKKGLFREMEVGLVLTASVARELAKFLNEQAKLLDESARAQAPSTTARPGSKR